jgi:hypothetical protein
MRPIDFFIKEIEIHIKRIEAILPEIKPLHGFV